MLACHLRVVVPVVVVVVPVDPLVLRVPQRVLRKAEIHGTAPGAGLAEPDFEGVKLLREEALSS